MKRRRFVIGATKVVGAYVGVAAAGSLPQLVRINTVLFGDARAQAGDPCVCEAGDLCVCEGNDLVVCPSDGHGEPCTPDVCTVQDGCLTGDTPATCRVRDVCGVDLSGECRSDSCDLDSSGDCVDDLCTADSSKGCNADQCDSDSSGACRGDQCEADSSGSCVTDACPSDKSGDCRNDQCVSDKSGACVSDDCVSDSSGGCRTDACQSDSSGACRSDTCRSDSSGACIGDSCLADSSKSCTTDQCTSDSSGACTGDLCDADSSGDCVTDRCTSDKSAGCRNDQCVSDKSGACTNDRCVSDSSKDCATSDVCVHDSSGLCDVDLCRADNGGDCATRDVCATDTSPPVPPVASVNRAMRWLFRLSIVLLAAGLAPDEARSATVIDARDAVFSVDPVLQTGQAVNVPGSAGPFIRDCDNDGVDEADTNGDGLCAGDPELRDDNLDGSRELPDGTPFAGNFRFGCFNVDSDVALVATGPVVIETQGDVGIHGVVDAAAGFDIVAQGGIDIRTSAWMMQGGDAPTFRTRRAGGVDVSNADHGAAGLPALRFAGACSAKVEGGPVAIPASSGTGLALLILATAVAAAALLSRDARGAPPEVG